MQHYYLLFCAASLVTGAYSFTCSDFVEGACELSENNIVGSDRFTDTANECQSKCKINPECAWFTHLDTQCYLLKDCGHVEHCDGCTSGPTEPDLATCPWPPGPSPSTSSTTSAPSTTTGDNPAGCEDFQQGTCELNENNIVGNDRYTDTPAQCQQKCIDMLGCHWFTHFDTFCYMLDHCGTLTNCETCVSGPTSPDISTCPWPPQPTTSSPTPTTPSTTVPTTTPTTTIPTTTTTRPTTTTAPTTPRPTSTTPRPTTATTSRVPLSTTTEFTSRAPLSTTTEFTSRAPLKTTTKTTSRAPLVTTSTPRPTNPPTTPTTTQSSTGCDDIRVNENCDWNYGIMHWYENVLTGNQCQQLCRNINGANYFSHYNEGRNAEHGYCGCFSECAWPSSAGCYNTCGTREVFYDEDVFDEVSETEDDSSETFGLEQDVELIRSGEPRPGPHYCHCMRGPLYPDIDGCGIWPDIF